ncbi:MAG: cysteine desulfurase [Verrucomicrobiota bacterium]|nr:cysteine desulfurase [Verrucomicrobiota bacterium]
MIYLDYNATTPLDRRAAAAMQPFLGAFCGNPSSIHRAGREARAALDNARDKIAALLRAKPNEIIFTSGGTESDNLAIVGLARAHATRGKHLITATTEHHAVLHAFEHLQKRDGFRVTWLAVDHFGRIDLAELTGAIGDDTTLVSIMSANNETGTLQPVGDIARVCHERGVLFHCDMVQSFGKIPVDVRRDGPDAISISAHKFYGPPGAGTLWLRSGISIEKIHYGGSHENERRPGTENVAAIVGMAEAAALAVADAAAEQTREAELKEALRAGLQSIFPGAIFNGHPSERLANTLSATFPGADAETLLINLDLAGICASSGAACMVGSVLPSHVLLAMGVAPELAKCTIRFSLGKQTTPNEITSTIDSMSKIFARLEPALAE